MNSLLLLSLKFHFNFSSRAMEQDDPSVSDSAAARADGGGEGALPPVRHPVFVCFFRARFFLKKNRDEYLTVAGCFFLNIFSSNKCMVNL